MRRNMPLIYRTLDPERFESFVRFTGKDTTAFQTCALALMESRRAPLQLLTFPTGKQLMVLSVAREALGTLRELASQWHLAFREISQLSEGMPICTLSQLGHLPVPTPHSFSRLPAWQEGSAWFVALDTPEGAVGRLLAGQQVSSVRFATQHAHLTYFASATPFNAIYHFFARHQIPCRRALGIPYGQTIHESHVFTPDFQALLAPFALQAQVGAQIAQDGLRQTRGRESAD